MTRKKDGDANSAALGCLLVVAAMAGLVLMPLLLIAWLLVEIRHARLPGMEGMPEDALESWLESSEQEYRLLMLARAIALSILATGVVAVVITAIYRKPDDLLLGYVGVSAIAAGLVALMTAAAVLAYANFTTGTRKAAHQRAWKARVSSDRIRKPDPRKVLIASPSIATSNRRTT
jgi:hypothetical protein